ncbi:MAG: class I SAM-dependent methyltransferase [Rhizobiaceae bacterium]|nr:class I SAM-dependent methyltransferase [Rhizobiaceae bacterium]
MGTVDQAALMDRVYRLQRRFGFYDATRKYYLLARDPMLAGLRPPQGGTVLEIGCGTGRNLVHAARTYPDATFHGIDISREMLAAAAANVERAGMRERIRLAWADAADFDPARTFGFDGYDRIFLSYAVSMIPQWRAVMAQAARHLAPGGEIHVAEFGDMAALPGWAKSAMYTWLRWYHVTPRSDLFDVARDIADLSGGTSEAHRLHRGFSWISVVQKADG